MNPLFTGAIAMSAPLAIVAFLALFLFAPPDALAPSSPDQCSAAGDQVPTSPPRNPRAQRRRAERTHRRDGKKRGPKARGDRRRARRITRNENHS